MTTIATDLRMDADVVGRDVWLVSEARVVRFDGTCLVDETDARHGPGDFVVLPRSGEYVAVGEGAGRVQGHFLGLAGTGGPVVSGWVLPEAEVEPRVVRSGYALSRASPLPGTSMSESPRVWWTV